MYKEIRALGLGQFKVTGDEQDSRSLLSGDTTSDRLRATCSCAMSCERPSTL